MSSEVGPSHRLSRRGISLPEIGNSSGAERSRENAYDELISQHLTSAKMRGHAPTYCPMCFACSVNCIASESAPSTFW